MLLVTDESYKRFLDDVLEDVLAHIEGLQRQNGNIKHFLKTPAHYRPELAYWSERAARIRAAKLAVSVPAWDIIVNERMKLKIAEEARRRAGAR